MTGLEGGVGELTWGCSFSVIGAPRRCEAVRLRGAGARQRCARDRHALGPLAATDRLAGGLRALHRAALQRALGRVRRDAGGAVKGGALGKAGKAGGDGGARRDNDDDDDNDDEEDLEAKLDARSLGPVAGARVRGAAVHADVDAVVSGVGCRGKEEGGENRVRSVLPRQLLHADRLGNHRRLR